MTLLEAREVLRVLIDITEKTGGRYGDAVNAAVIMRNEVKRIEAGTQRDTHEDHIPLRCGARKNVDVRVVRKDRVTGELVCVKKGEMTEEERKNYEEIVKSFRQ